MRTRTLHRLLLVWTLFIGAGALLGFAMMMMDPSGARWEMDPLLEGMQTLPLAHILFRNFIFPGIALLLLIGMPQLSTSWLLLRKNRLAARAGMVSGLILMAWIIIQFIIWDFNPLSNIYFVFGTLEFLNGLFLFRRQNQ